MHKILKKLIQKISSFIEKKSRDSFMRKSANFNGEYTIEEDQIIFRVNGEAINNQFQNESIYSLKLNDFFNVSNERRRLGLDKEIVYYFENIHFDKALSVENRSGETIHFKNCHFEKEICLHYIGDYIFEENTYRDDIGIYFHTQDLFFEFGLRSLTFLNETLINEVSPSKYCKHLPKIGLNLAKNEIGILKIINSKIKIGGVGEIQAHVKNFICKNSSITAPNIYLEAEHIKENNSTLTATEGLIIENKEKNSISSMKAPVIIYNGEILPNKNKPISIPQEETPIARSRRLLITALHEMRNQAISTIEEEHKKAFTHPICKVLKNPNSSEKK